MRTARWLFDYLCFPVVSVPLCTLVWMIMAPGRLYHCWDDAPPFVISWFPPFIHPEANSLDGGLVDYYIWPSWVVHAVWGGLAALMIVAPVLAVFLVDRIKKPRPAGLSSSQQSPANTAQ